MTKTLYMRYNFNNSRNRHENIVKLDGQEVPLSKIFKYLGSIIKKDREINKDIIHTIKTGWLK